MVKVNVKSDCLLVMICMITVLAGLIASSLFIPSSLAAQFDQSCRKNVVCILVEFSDVVHSRAAVDIEADLNRMEAYWNDVSYGLLNVDSVVTGWYKLSKSMGYYGSDFAYFCDYNLLDLVVESIELADKEVNFLHYDMVMIVHAGAGQEVCSLLPELEGYTAVERIGSCAFLNLSIATDDGKIIEEVAVVPEMEQTVEEEYDLFGLLQDFDVLGVYAHEFGHLLGLPDLYDPTQLFEENKNVGKWSLMSEGAHLDYLGRPCHPLAWSKMKLGWISPQIVTPTEKPEIVTLRPLESESHENSGIITLSTSTYYMVELRLKKGLDDHLPDEGIIITFIDETDPENPQVEVVDSTPSTPTKDDAAFQLEDQFNSENLNVLISEATETSFSVAFSSQPFQDKDNDDLLDLLEEEGYGTNPNSQDTDGDGLTDGYEILRCTTDPTISDSDHDGVPDGKEFDMGTSPIIADTDCDYWNDGIDPLPTEGNYPNYMLIPFLAFPLALISRKLHKRHKKAIQPTLAKPYFSYEHGMPSQQDTILAVHEENGLTHTHEAFGDPPEITEEEYNHLLECAKQNPDEVILVPTLKIDGNIVEIPQNFQDCRIQELSSETRALEKELKELEDNSDLDLAYAVGNITKETYLRKMQEEKISEKISCRKFVLDVKREELARCRKSRASARGDC